VGTTAAVVAVAAWVDAPAGAVVATAGAEVEVAGSPPHALNSRAAVRNAPPNKRLKYISLYSPSTSLSYLVTLSGAKSLVSVPDETEILRCAQNDLTRPYYSNREKESERR
jgi:hypothetical protein